MPASTTSPREWRYRSPVVDPQTLVLAVSQSGETADTLAASAWRASAAPSSRSPTSWASQLTREADGVLYTRAGLEIGVAATKTFTAQVVLPHPARAAPRRAARHAVRRAARRPGAELQRLPALAARVLADDSPLWAQVEQRRRSAFYEKEFFLFLGRHLGLPVCLEGALKLKEICYIPTDAYAAGEMKHGPIALLADDTPVVAVVTDSHVYEKVVSNVAGGARPRRARHRGRHGGQHRASRACGRRARGPAHVARARAGPGGDPAAAALLPHRAAARPRRRQAAQPGQDRHRGMSAAPGSLPATLELVRERMRALPVMEVYEVGGSLRDQVLGRQPKELDFLVRGHPVEELRDLLAAEGRAEDLTVAGRLVGVRFWPRWGPRQGIEVVVPRRERALRPDEPGYTGNPHTDFAIEPDAALRVELDLGRRDFTVNAMACDLRSGDWIDPFDGRGDARGRVLRAVHPEAFRDDPLRHPARSRAAGSRRSSARR